MDPSRADPASPTPLSVGIVGAGQISADAHVPALLALEGARLAWIVDRDDARARLLSRSVGLEPVGVPADPADLPAADVVLLAIPYGARPPYLRRLSERRSAVYVEKPFAMNREEHEELCSLFPPERMACGFQRRSQGTAQALREIVRTRLFGRLTGVSVEFGGPGSRAGSYQGDLKMAGGGILFDVGVHALDLALFVAGAVRADVRSVDMIREGRLDVHTEATVEAEDASGLPVEIALVVSSLRFTALRNTYRFEHAEVAHAMWGDGSLTVRPLDSAATFSLGGWDYPQAAGPLFHRHWSVFLEGIRAREANYTSASDTLLTTLVLDQLYARGG